MFKQEIRVYKALRDFHAKSDNLYAKKYVCSLLHYGEINITDNYFISSIKRFNLFDAEKTKWYFLIIPKYGEDISHMNLKNKMKIENVLQIGI